MKTTSNVKRGVLVGGVVLLLVLTLGGLAAAQGTCVQPPAGLVSWWPGDGNADDIVGGNHGTLQGAASFVQGIVDQAFGFSADGFADIPQDPAIFALRQGTVDMWVRILSLDTDVVRLFSIAQRGIPFPFSHHWEIDYRGTGGPAHPPARTIEVSLVRDGSIVFGAFTPTVINDTNFHHVAVVADGAGTIEVYVDGVLQPLAFPLGSPADGFFGDAPQADNMKIGAVERDTLRAEGDKVIDEVEIFNRPLSASEIQAIFNAGSAGKCKVVPFAVFDAKVEIEEDEFEVKGTFMLGAASDGIDIPTEIVSLELTGGTGAFSATIPAGFFEQVEEGEFKFEGIIDGVFLEVKITPLGNGDFEFKAEGEGADLTGMANPVTVVLTIGNDSDTTTVEAEFE